LPFGLNYNCRNVVAYFNNHFMRIGYDAKRYYNNKTGLGNYSRTLVHTLAELHPEHEYHLFTPKMDATFVQDLMDTTKVDAKSQHFQVGGIHTHLPNGFGRKLPSLWRSYFIKNDVQKANIQLFHGLSGELPLSISKKVKTVVTIHDLIHERYPQFYPFFDRKMYSWKFKSACQKADVIVAISEQTKRDIIDFYKIEESKIKVIYQSCHPQFKLSNQSNLGANYFIQKYKLPENYLLYVGTINERKNLMAILRAFAEKDALDTSLNLVIVGTGKGSYVKQSIHFLNQSNLGNRVFMLQNLDYEDFPYIYKNALALVYPSFFEGFGIPIIEAMWSGCPVITSEGGCFAEAGGPDTLYVNPHSFQDIGRAIAQLTSDNILRKQMILRGQEYVKKFDTQSIGNQWIELYESLL
jgi:glycosyltransferase involved in cell wall biosynthesis